MVKGLHINIENNVMLLSYLGAIAGLLLIFFIRFHTVLKKFIKSREKALRKGDPKKSHGIIFGSAGDKVVYSPENEEGSVGVFAATGAGKTSAIGIPTLRSWKGPGFVIDISGDVEKNCPNIQNKLTFAPDEENSCVYNIFGALDRLQSPAKKHEALEELVYMLLPQMPHMGEAGSFFLKGGRRILTGAMIYGYDKGMDFIEICKLVNGNSYPSLFKLIDESGNRRAITYINAFHGTNEKNTSGCYQSACDAINLFATIENMEIIKRPEGEEIAIEPCDIEDKYLFIKVPDPKTELYGPMLNIITSQVMQYISNRKVTSESKTILLFLDEYASLRMSPEAVLAALRKYRKRKCRIMILTQNLSDLDILYGHDTTRAILANLKFKVLLGALQEPESQKYFAELIGQKVVKAYSKATSNRDVTITETESREYVIEPADLDRQGDDSVLLLFPGGKGYMHLKKNFYFR